MVSPTRNLQYINSNSKKSGFTLLEVLIVVGLALLVITAVYSILFFAGTSTARTRATLIKKQEMMRLYYTMRHQLINAYKPEKGAILMGEQGVKERESELYFVTSTLERYRSVGEVGYKIMHDYKGNAYLAYREFPFPRINDRFLPFLQFRRDKNDEEWHPLSTMVKEFLVEYETDGQWVKEWNQDELPEKIRITLWYVEEDKTEEEKFLSTDKGLRPFRFVVVPGLKSVF